MGTHSVIINFIVRVFQRLNHYFEYSFIYKILAAIGRAGRTSLIVGWVRNVFFTEQKRNYYSGSIFLRTFTGVFGFLMNAGKNIFLWLAKLNRSSWNKALFDYVTSFFAPDKWGGLAFAALGGFFAIRASMASVLDTGGGAFTLLALISIVCFVLAFVSGPFLVKAVKGSMPYKLMIWLFQVE